MGSIFSKWQKMSLVKRIMIGFGMGTALALFLPELAKPVATLGTLFVAALKSLAPLLVLTLVISAISRHKQEHGSKITKILFLYILVTCLSGFLAVLMSFAFPVELILPVGTEQLTPPGNISEVLNTLLISSISNPVKAILDANYIGILVWAAVLGVALRDANETTKNALHDIAMAVSKVVKWVIELAPLGIMGLVFSTVSTIGLEGLGSYAYLLSLLVGTMLIVALLINPLIAYVYLRRNPYPLVWRCLKRSGVTAFFTRSSAANIPVNMELCEELSLNEDSYSVSIPLGATINMAGAAITISVLTLAAVNTLGIQVDFATAVLLSLVSAVSACGASGVAGGSLLLIPLACSLFGISNDVAMQVVAVGFVIGVVQDSFETALNSSTDVLLTAVAELSSEPGDSDNLQSVDI